MNQVSVDFKLANHNDVIMAELGRLDPDRVRRVRLRGIVDPRVMRLVLPQSAVEQLGLVPSDQATVRLADRRPLVKGVSVELLGRQGVFTAFVEPNRTTALIGAIVMEDLDFLVDCATQTLQPRDPNGIVGEIE
jgi:predicted aspartyl protease